MVKEKLYQYEKRKILIWKAPFIALGSNLNLDGVSSLERSKAYRVRSLILTCKQYRAF